MSNLNVTSNDIARAIYRSMGYDVSPSHDLGESFHPQERLCSLLGDLAERLALDPEGARDTIYEWLEDRGVYDFEMAASLPQEERS